MPHHTPRHPSQSWIAAILFATALTPLSAQSPPKPENLVTLEMAINSQGGCGTHKLDFVRITADGGPEPGFFRIPEGHTLIINGIDWYYAGGAPGAMQFLSVIVENTTNRARRGRVFESTINLGADGAGGASERLTTGFAVSSSARLCLETYLPLGSPLRLSKVLLRGYLTR